MTRLLSMSASELVALDRVGLRDAIAESEGRTIAAETIGVTDSLIDGVTNAELVAAMGADLLLLNFFDVDAPDIHGLPACAPADVVHTVQRLTGRVVGINLEPVGVPAGRLASADNARRAVDLGVQWIVVTANPGTGADNAATLAAIREVSGAVADRALVVGGRMHGSGVVRESGARIISVDDVTDFVEAGADVVLVPAPGTIPGMTIERVQTLVDAAHDAGALAMTAIGTSQEGADADTIRAIALASKQAGADVHHLGDAGWTGIADPENVMTYSIAVRGRRHTYRRMALSINR